MKKTLSGIFWSLLSCCCFVIFSACGGSPAPAQSAPDPAPAAESSAPAYTGDGGKGMSIAILAPEATGLGADQGYIPALVQGELVSNFSTYSALSVLDRERLDAQYAELHSGYYDDNAEAGRDLGRLTPTDYIMGGNITKTATGYALQISVTKTADKTTAASYSGTCAFAELDNLSGVRRASLDLLQKMGIIPTERTQTELATAAGTGHVKAQTALAQGITARQQGTTVEALTYYYQAASFDPFLIEAANRASVMTAAITSGNIGANVRNDIQRRDEWLRILREAAAYYQQHPPFEIVYDTALQQDLIDYEKRTVQLSCEMFLVPSPISFAILNNLSHGLDNTGKRREWGFQSWPFGSSSDTVVLDEGNMYFRVTVGLKNDSGRTIGTAEARLSIEDFWPIRRQPIVEMISSYSSVPAAIDRILRPEIHRRAAFVVKADDITDSLSVVITSINGISAEDAANRGYISVSTIVNGFSAIGGDVTEGYNYVLYKNAITITKSNISARNIDIPERIEGCNVTYINTKAFAPKSLTSVTIPNSVTDIASDAFPQSPNFSESFTSVTIGANVNLAKDAFPNSLASFYDSNGKKAGTYTYNHKGRKWSFKAR